MKVLLVAYACEPGKGSEPGVGWNWAVELSKYINVTVLTRANNKSSIENALKTTKKENLSFIYYDISFLSKIKKKIPLGIQIYYSIWQLFSCLYVKRKFKSNFNIVHHLTFNTISIPSFGWLVSKNFIWGPVGGGQAVSLKFIRHFDNNIVFELIRTFLVSLSKYNLFIIACSYFSSRIIVINGETESRIWYKKKIIRMLETGVKANSIIEKKINSTDKRCTLLWIGNFEGHKAPLLFLNSLPYLDDGKDVLLVGKGSLKKKIIMKCDSIKNSSIKIIEHVEYDQILSIYKKADIFVFTSLRDSSGNVVLEAMSQGLPIIAFDHQGVHDILTDECAIKIPVSNYKEMVKNLASAIEKLADNRELRFEMGKASIQRIRDNYLWEDKAKRMVDIYEEVLNENSPNS